jgi:hypothetical protein
MLGYLKYTIARHKLSTRLRAAYKADDRAVSEMQAAGAASVEIYNLKSDQAQDNWILEDELQQLALLWQNLAIDWRNWIPESDFQ